VDIWLHYAGAALVLYEPAPLPVLSPPAPAATSQAVTVADGNVSRPSKPDRKRPDARRSDKPNKKRDRRRG
jgi:hypothetical protein